MSCRIEGILLAAVSSCLLAVSASAQEGGYRFQYGLDSSPQFVSWKTRSTGQRGYQFYSPTQLTAKAIYGEVLELDFGLKSAFIHSRNTMLGYGGGVSTLSDTVIQLQATYKGWGALQPFATLALNLPTGKATLKGKEHRGVMDKDLVYQTRFGEGWNWNPGVGLAYAISNDLTATFGIGYNFRGSYIPDGDSGVNYQPGDQVIATTSLSWQTKEYALSLTGIATFENASFQDGVRHFKPGNSYTLSGNATRIWNDQLSTTISGSYTHTGRNKTLDFFTEVYAKESQNSNSAVYSGSVQQTYQINAPWSVFARASYLYRDKNLYDPVSNYYVSAKRKLTGEIGANYAVAQNISLNASLGLFRLKQASTPYAEALKSRGVTGSFGVRLGF